MVNVEIGRNEAGQRLDRFLKKYLVNAPLSYIYKAIRKDVKVNGKRRPQDAVLSEGDVVSLYLADEEVERLTAKPERKKAKRQFQIAYEDDNIIAVEKPYGLLTHGDRTEKKNHLANQVVDYLIETGAYSPRTEKTFVPAPVNRLDRNTTGLVLFGKNAMAVKELNEAIRERTSVSKFYLTVVAGEMKKPLVLKDRMRKDREKNVVSLLSGPSEDGKDMETVAGPVLTGNGFTLAEVEILTGRTHQIRVQLAGAGYPLIGDPKYGDRAVNRRAGDDFGLRAQLLHAYRLKFGQLGGELSYLSGLEIKSELPEEFRRICGLIFGDDAVEV